MVLLKKNHYGLILP